MDKEELRKYADSRVTKQDVDLHHWSALDAQKFLYELRTHQIELEMQNEELRRIQKELAESRDHYADLYDFAPVGYLTLGEKDVILDANISAAEMLDCERTYLKKKSFSEFIVSQDQDHYYLFKRRLLSNSKVKTVELQLINSKNKSIFVKLIGNKIDTSDKKPARYRLSIMDITQLKESEDALRRAKKEADNANRAKSKFIASVSHDLRQPVQALTLLNGILLKTCKEHKSLGLIHNQTRILKTLHDLLRSILDLSKVEAGGTINVSVFPVAEVLDQIKLEFSEEARKKNLTLTVLHCSARIRSDRSLLQNILRNLMSNALKYTPKGRVLLGCRRHQNSLHIEVWDTGIGIAAELIQAVFNDFFQLRDAHQNNIGHGDGLGLAIVKRTAGLLKHTIHVKSNPGKGSMFAVSVPMEKTQIDIAQQVECNNVLVDPSFHPCILLVEDDSDVLNSLNLYLKLHGFEIRMAGDREAAVDSIRFNDTLPDLIVTDYRLPMGVTGEKLLCELNTICGKKIPSILLTGDVSVMERQTKFDNVCCILGKPIDPDVLVEQIKHVIIGNRSV